MRLRMTIQKERKLNKIKLEELLLQIHRLPVPYFINMPNSWLLIKLRNWTTVVFHGMLPNRSLITRALNLPPRTPNSTPLDFFSYVGICHPNSRLSKYQESFFFERTWKLLAEVINHFGSHIMILWVVNKEVKHEEFFFQLDLIQFHTLSLVA